MNKSRLLSSVIALIYITIAFVSDGQKVGFQVLIFLILPLACIWFSESIGAYKSPYSMHATRATPATFVAIGGWILLLMPLIAGVISTLLESN